MRGREKGGVLVDGEVVVGWWYQWVVGGVAGVGWWVEVGGEADFQKKDTSQKHLSTAVSSLPLMPWNGSASALTFFTLGSTCREKIERKEKHCSVTGLFFVEKGG